MDTLGILVDTALAVEKVRVRTQVRQSHLALHDRKDAETDALLERLKHAEQYVDERVAVLLKAHPAYPWFSRVKGIGRENIGKVVGLVDISRADTISSLWKFAGFSVEDGHAPRREKDEKLNYNSQLRSMCWRLGGNLLKAKGCFYSYYLAQKERYQTRYITEGKQIVPAASLPKIGGKKVETDAFISEGHIHALALRKMIKLFLACLWLEWRKAEGLPITTPYAIGVLGHNSVISPEEMIDKASSRKQPKSLKRARAGK